VPIAPSTYYEHHNREPSRREVRDEELKLTSVGYMRVITVYTELAKCGSRLTARESRWPVARWRG